MLLRQTRAESVAALWDDFISEYPTPRALAGARQPVLRQRIQPLGFGKQRSSALISAAKWLLEHHDGHVPRTEAELLQIPHVGLYTARAILCFAFGIRQPIVDANILRFFSRYYRLKGQTDIRRNLEAWQIAETILPGSSKRARQHNYGLLDFTAEICRPRGGQCSICPLATSCQQPSPDKRN